MAVLPDIMQPDFREDKLPGWAKALLANARNRVKSAEKGELEARLATDPYESNMLVDRYDDIPIGLGKRPTVRVVLQRKASGEIDRWIDFRFTESMKSVEIMGDAAIRITPQVANCIAITTMQGAERGEV